MCLGTIARLTETWEEDGARVGRLEDGAVVSLAFVPDAARGADLLLHLGIPVEVLGPDHAAQALALRAHARTTHDGGLR